MKIIFSLIFFFACLQVRSQGIISINSSFILKEDIKIEIFYGHQLIPLNSLDFFQKKDQLIIRLPTLSQEGFYRLSANEGYTYDLIITKNDSISLSIKKDINKKDLFITEIGHSLINIELKELKDELTPIKVAIHQAEQSNNVDVLVALQSAYNGLIERSTLRTKNMVYEVLAGSNKYRIYSDSSLSFQESYCNNLFINKYLFQDLALYSNILPTRYFDYFSRCTSYDEAGFKKTVDMLLSLSKSNSKIYEYTLFYLLELFEKVGPETIFQYIVNNYVRDQSCFESEENLAAHIKEKIKKLQQVFPGNKAPEIIVNEKKYFFEKESPTLVVFWSSHCPYCKIAITELNNISSSDLDVVGISLDQDKNEYEDFLAKNKINIKTTCDLKGWDSENVKKYAVSKTPLMVLVGVTGNIQNYDITIEELKEKFKFSQ